MVRFLLDAGASKNFYDRGDTTERRKPVRVSGSGIRVQGLGFRVEG